MRLDSRTMIVKMALAALTMGVGGCSDDGVPTQQNDATGAGDGDGSSGISTTMTAGGVTMTSPADGDGTGDDTGSPPPPPTTGTTDEPAGSTGGLDDGGTASGTGSGTDTGSGSDTGTGSGSGSESGSGSDSGTDGDSGTDSEGGSSSDGGGALCDASPTPGMLPIGTACNGVDSACASGVCYDFADYDPFCGGTACSVCCETDQDCIDALQAAGVPPPIVTSCLADNRCDMLGTGLGGPYFCAGG